MSHSVDLLLTFMCSCYHARKTTWDNTRISLGIIYKLWYIWEYFFNNNNYEVGVQDAIGKSCCYVPSIIVILFMIHLFTLPWVWTIVLSLPPPVLPAPTITRLEPLNSTTLTLEWQVGCSICTRENHGGFQWMLFLETSRDFKLHLVAMPNSQWHIHT